MSKFPRGLQNHLTAIHAKISGDKYRHPLTKCQICQKKLSPDDTSHDCIGEQQLPCEYCDRSLKSLTELMTHLSNDHADTEKMVYACDLCRRPFDMRILMEAHRVARHLTCTKCPATFDTMSKCYYHKQNAHVKQSKRPI